MPDECSRRAYFVINDVALIPFFYIFVELLSKRLNNINNETEKFIFERMLSFGRFCGL